MNPNKLACEHGHQRGKCVYCDNATLLRERDKMADMLRTSQRGLADARKALEWYGDHTRYEHGVYTDRCGKPMAGREIMYDHGERAREALKGGGE